MRFVGRPDGDPHSMVPLTLLERQRDASERLPRQCQARGSARGDLLGVARVPRRRSRVHALALMALRLVGERDAERDTTLPTLDLAARLTTQLGRTTDQNRELQDRLRVALTLIAELKSAK